MNEVIANETTTEAPVVEMIEARELNHVEMMVANFRQRMLEDNGELGVLQVAGLEIVWKQIAVAYELGKTILDPANEADYKAALERCDIKPVGEKGNKWLPVTKLLFGSFVCSDGTLAPWNSGLDTVFEQDRSAEKYACVFRYFEKFNIPVCDVFDTIKGFNEDGYGRNLKGIEAKDRKLHGPGKSNSSVSDDDAEDLGSRTDLKDVIVFQAPEGFKATKGTALFTVKEGKIYLLGTTELDDAQFTTKAIARGKKLVAAHKDKATVKSTVAAVADLLAA